MNALDGSQAGGRSLWAPPDRSHHSPLRRLRLYGAPGEVGPYGALTRTEALVFTDREDSTTPMATPACLPGWPRSSSQGCARWVCGQPRLSPGTRLNDRLSRRLVRRPRPAPAGCPDPPPPSDAVSSPPCRTPSARPARPTVSPHRARSLLASARRRHRPSRALHHRRLRLRLASAGQRDRRSGTAIPTPTPHWVCSSASTSRAARGRAAPSGAGARLRLRLPRL